MKSIGLVRHAWQALREQAAQILHRANMPWQRCPRQLAARRAGEPERPSDIVTIKVMGEPWSFLRAGRIIPI